MGNPYGVVASAGLGRPFDFWLLPPSLQALGEKNLRVCGWQEALG
ncbi:hypothetical protein [Pseudomonas sp. MWU16-30317]|jgi:hypothetical protein|nr:hypothetical protein [Pseudomonas sp. MWU16-30317]